MHNPKKILGYAGTALAIGVGLFFVYAIVGSFANALLGASEERTRFLTRLLKKPILYVCVLAAVTAYVKLRQKYRGENK